MLRNRLPEIEIPEDNPFKEDRLSRETCVDTFCALVKMYSTTGCVIALDGEWGTGKTTFVKMLMQKMRNKGGHPLYFNAWENDYVSDPLIALLSELKALSPNSDKWDNVIASGGKILANIVTLTTKNILKNKLGIDSELVTTGIDEVGKILKDSLDEYAKQKTTFVEFRNSLQNYVADYATEDNPVVFFIDELDRCSPRFSVLVLERIKHLFDIPNVVFVLSLNKKQLGYAIQGYYGSANINAHNYLRRFIDIEYSLPRPNGDEFCRYLYDIYKFDEIFEHEKRLQYSELQSDGESFKRIASILVSSTNLELRTIDKIFAHTRLALMWFGRSHYIIPDVFFLLCYLKITNPEHYHNIFDARFTVQELLSLIEGILPLELLVMNKNDSTWRKMTYTIALFIYMYSIDDNGRERETIINNGGKSTALQTTHLDSNTFCEALSWVLNGNKCHGIPLNHLIRRIELQRI